MEFLCFIVKKNFIFPRIFFLFSMFKRKASNPISECFLKKIEKIFEFRENIWIKK